MSDTVIKLIVVVVFALIPTGVFLAMYFENLAWLLVSLGAFIFFYAG